MSTSEERSPWIALARSSCVFCSGTGIADGEHCNCVLRQICRAVVGRLRAVETRGLLRPANLDAMNRANGKPGRGFLEVEWAADVKLIARRVLSELDWRIFRDHCLGDHDWKECCPRLGVNRGPFFYRLYTLEAKLGAVFIETRPHAVWPVFEYFHAHCERVASCPIPAVRHANGIPLRPPLARRRRGPVVVPMNPDSAPIPKLNTEDPAEVEEYSRQRLRAGVSLRLIATELTRLSGDWWVESRVKRLLIAPGAKRAA